MPIIGRAVHVGERRTRGRRRTARARRSSRAWSRAGGISLQCPATTSGRLARQGGGSPGLRPGRSGARKPPAPLGHPGPERFHPFSGTFGW